MSDERDENGFLTKLTTPVGGELSEDELRAIEHVYRLNPGTLVRGVRTGPRDVSVTQRPEAIHELKLTMIV